MPKPRLPTLALLAALAVLPRSAGAQAPEPPPASAAGPSQPKQVALLLRLGLDFGGTTLAKVSWSDGKTGSIKGGQLFLAALGLFYLSPTAPWALEANVGYKFDKVNGANGSISFSRLPLELIGSYVVSGHRLGAGPVAHLSPRFRCDAAGVCNDEVTFPNAVGGVVQWAYGGQAVAGADVGVRYTFIRYQAAGARIDGSGFGFFFGYRF